MYRITLDYGAADPLVLECREDASVSAFDLPRGVAGDEARQMTAEALAASIHAPPLVAHVVPGDRVVVGLQKPVH